MVEAVASHADLLAPQTAYCSAIPTVFDVPSVRETKVNRALPLVTLSMLLTPGIGINRRAVDRVVHGVAAVRPRPAVGLGPGVRRVRRVARRQVGLDLFRARRQSRPDARDRCWAACSATPRRWLELSW